MRIAFRCSGCPWTGERHHGARKCLHCHADLIPARPPMPTVLSLKKSLLRIAARCEDWTAADVRAAVADTLGITVEELMEQIRHAHP